MKAIQLKNPRKVQSVINVAGCRILTILPNPLRRRHSRQRDGVLRLFVESAPEELSGFEPVIRFHR